MLLVLLACTERPSVSLPVPHVAAAGGFEGEALVAAGFGALGFDVHPEDVFDAAGIDPVLGRGGAREGDPTGYETFRRVVGDEGAFQAEWQVWAAGLE